MNEPTSNPSDPSTLVAIEAPDPKPGIKTSEFWLSVLVILCVFILILTNKVHPEPGLAAIAAATSIYTGARAWTKRL